MSQIIGQKYRVEVDTSTNETPAWKKFKHEVSFDTSHTSDKIETSSKDTGKHKDYLKTLIDSTVNCTAREDTVPGSGYISYADIYAMWAKNHSDTNQGKFSFRLSTSEVGGSVLTFTAFVETCSSKYENNGLVEYTFTLQITTLPVLATVTV